MTGGQTDEELARFMIRESKDILGWIVEQGVRWQPSLGGTLSLGRTNSFFLGGGRAMLNALYLTAERLGVDVALRCRGRRPRHRRGIASYQRTVTLRGQPMPGAGRQRWSRRLGASKPISNG